MSQSQVARRAASIARAQALFALAHGLFGAPQAGDVVPYRGHADHLAADLHRPRRGLDHRLGAVGPVNPEIRALDGLPAQRARRGLLVQRGRPPVQRPARHPFDDLPNVHPDGIEAIGLGE